MTTSKREFTYKEFRKKYGLTHKDRNKLKRLRIIEIFQGGYKGHSTCHHKKVRIKNLTRFREYLTYLEVVNQKQGWLEPIPENFTEFERQLESYFRKEAKKPKDAKPAPVPEAVERYLTVQSKGITRSQFNEITKTIRGDYGYISDYQS